MASVAVQSQNQQGFTQDPATYKGTALTCISCKMMFPTPKDQREHYKTELHRFNLKRKVANLPPVTKEVFELKVKAMGKDQDVQEEDNAKDLTCDWCDKFYNSENQYAQHLKTKKHLDRVASGQKKEKPKPKQTEPKEKPEVVLKPEDIEGLSPEEVEALKTKLQNAYPLAIEDCLFCRAKSVTFEANLDHMTKQHGLFIPDIEYVTDLQGLIKYLGEKVAVGNVCLWCNGKGKSFNSIYAVQQHMEQMGHCKIFYDGNEDEFEEFYDFSSDYGEGNKDEEVEFESKLQVSDAGTELIFEDGRIVAHRSVALFYRQRFRLPETRESVLVNSLMAQYRQLGWYDTHQRQTNQVTDVRRHRDNIAALKIGIKHNNQPHHRKQNTIIA